MLFEIISVELSSDLAATFRWMMNLMKSNMNTNVNTVFVSKQKKKIIFVIRLVVFEIIFSRIYLIRNHYV